MSCFGSNKTPDDLLICKGLVDLTIAKIAYGAAINCLLGDSQKARTSSFFAPVHIIVAQKLLPLLTTTKQPWHSPSLCHYNVVHSAWPWIWACENTHGYHVVFAIKSPKANCSLVFVNKVEMENSIHKNVYNSVSWLGITWKTSALNSIHAAWLLLCWHVPLFLFHACVPIMTSRVNYDCTLKWDMPVHKCESLWYFQKTRGECSSVCLGEHRTGCSPGPGTRVLLCCMLVLWNYLCWDQDNCDQHTQ